MTSIVEAAVRLVRSYWHDDSNDLGVARVVKARAIGQPLERVEGRAKILGIAPYAYEHPTSRPLYLHALQSTIARGRIAAIDTARAETLAGVLMVLTHENAPRLQSHDDRELAILQSDEVLFRGQIIGGVIAETAEIARHAASLVRVEYEQQSHDASFRAEHEGLYTPEQVNGEYPPDTAKGDVETALASAEVTIDATYETPMEHNNPMEPHTTVVTSTDCGFTIYDSTQSVHAVASKIAVLFDVPERRVRVVATHVGGGFGSKGEPHAHIVLAAMAAERCDRPVKLALTRQQMFSLVGYRPPTIQRVRLGADRSGKLAAICHEVIEPTARWKEYAEQTAVPSRVMYAAQNRLTTHRLVPLDIAVPSWMRAPGEEPGMFAAEVAMDELAAACGIDPIELRVRNEPEADPESGKPWSGRNLVGCLREGARRFGWEKRETVAAAYRKNGWLVGLGVAASTYPRYTLPGSRATIQFGVDRRYAVRIGAVDIGTGSWTALAQIAADALGCSFEDVKLEIGDSSLPHASVEGGSSGISSWGSTIVAAARAFREQHGEDPAEGAEATAEMGEDAAAERFAMHSFGAQFAEVHVDADTGEVRVPRMLGVFSVGRIINPRTARSQLIGGMTMGLSAALHEESILDPRFGHVVNGDLAGYHIATHADVGDIEAVWLDECDENSNAMGSRGIGEIGIVGAAAAIANAVHHATGIRVRSLPITPDKLLGSIV